MTSRRPVKIGVISGLAAETACLRASSGETFCSAANPARVEEGALGLIESGAEALLSFGVCGGLDPTLVPGSVILAETVVAPDGQCYASDSEWLNGFRSLWGNRGSLRIAPIAGSNRVVDSITAKRSLFESTGAVAVDMESHVAAKLAKDRGLPFLALRAIADPAYRSIPSAALVGLSTDGKPLVLPVFKRLLRRPWQLPGLLLLSGDMRKALAALRRVADTGLLGFGLFDIGNEGINLT